MTEPNGTRKPSQADHMPVSLHVEEQGQGPTIILMHGFGGSARNFRPQARALRKDHRVVLFDARGHARSAAPDDPDAYHPGAFVDDLHRIVTSAPEERVVIGGLSMGAGVALRYAIAHPDRVTALLLAAFPPGGEATRRWSLALAEAIERDGLEEAGRRFVWGGDRFDSTAQDLIRRGFLEHRPHALSAILRHVLATQRSVDIVRQEMGRVRVPIAVVVGENDAPSRDASEALAAASSNVKLTVIPGAGHVVNLSNPQLFNEATRDLLRKVEGQ